MQLSYPLCLGSKGDEVVALQKALNERGATPRLGTDGKFGRKTHRAVIQFQSGKSLKPDGVVGRNTASALGWHYNGSRAKPYFLRFETAPRSEFTSPVVLLGDVLRYEMRRYRDALAQTIRNTGAPEDKIANALDVLDDPGMASFTNRMDTWVTRTGVANTWTTLGIFEAIQTAQLYILEAGVYLKKHGGKTTALANRIDALNAGHIRNIFERVIAGDLETYMAQFQIELAFQLATREEFVIPA